MTHSRAIRAYVLAVTLAAAGALLVLPSSAPAQGAEAGVLGLLVVLSALAGARPVRIPFQRVHLTTTHPVLLCALAALGAYPAVLVALAGVVSSRLAHARSTAPIRLVFNLAAVTVSTAAAAWSFTALGAVPGAPARELLWPLTCATTVYFLVNTGLVTPAIALEKGLGLGQVWKSTFASIGVSYATGLSVTVCMLLLLDGVGPWGLALAVPPVWLLVAFYRNHLARLEERERRIREVEQLNTELAGTVSELRAALAHVRQLQGLLPICMHCKSIRDDKDTWHRLEAYIAAHSEATFTHALCGDCLTKHYPEIAAQRPR
jgi:hypothetical protein